MFVLYSTEVVLDLGGPWIHLYDFLGPGWILDKKEILGEPVKCLYSTEMVVDLGYTFMVSLGQGESWIRRKFLVSL